MQGNNKSNFWKVIVLVVALIVLGISTTYAYFTTQLSGNPSTTSLTSGNLKIETNLESVSAINNRNIRLINETDKTTSAEKVSFYVKNTSESTVDAKYYIYLKEITLTKNLYSDYFKWELVQNGIVVGSGNFGTATRTNAVNSEEANNVSTTAEDITLSAEPLLLNKNTNDNIIFRVWLENDENVNQISLTNGGFAGKLYLEAFPVSSNS